MALAPTEQETLNRKRYLKAPTVEQVNNFIEELGVSALQFERFYGIPDHTIPRIRVGTRDFPRKYWHIIYEKIVPTYGDGYAKAMSLKKKVTKKKKPAIKKKVTTSSDNRLSSL